MISNPLRLSAALALFAVVAVVSEFPRAQQVQEPTFPAPAIGASTASLHALFDSYWEWKLATQPELATRVGRTEFNDRWRDLSKASRERIRARRKEFLQELIYISTGNLTSADRLSANVLQSE